MIQMLMGIYNIEAGFTKHYCIKMRKVSHSGQGRETAESVPKQAQLFRDFVSYKEMVKTGHRFIYSLMS